jgi:hypothetical protein
MYECGNTGRPQRIAQNISNNPRMFARKMRKREALLFLREIAEGPRGRGQRIKHRGGCRLRVEMMRCGERRRHIGSIIDKEGADIGPLLGCVSKYICEIGRR